MSTRVKFAIEALNPSAKFRVLDDSVDKITWLENTTPIARSLITAKINEQQAAYENDYVRKRQEAYPSIWDQLDMIYWDQMNGTTKFKETITKVKTDIPKN
tara:strand:+ start:1788 stop:2090 length:303 start_codon:yes stop_codon:yes gene_type:complete